MFCTAFSFDKGADTMSSTALRLDNTRRALARRIVEHIRNDTSDLGAAPMLNDPSVYTDPARHALERQKLFRETPFVVCLSSDLPKPGSFRTSDEAGVPIFVVRDIEGRVRAYLNICVHRGARLVRSTEGQARAFTCWFHGWTYDTTGALRGAPEKERFGACIRDRHLVEVPAGERCGIVFVQATPGSTMDLDAHLGEFARELEILELGRSEFVKAGTLPVKTNWKYALDTYGEGYHAIAWHRESLGPLFRCDISIFDTYGPHFRIHFVEHSMKEWLDQPEDEWNAVDRLGGIHYIFPNTIIFAGKVKPGRKFYQMFRHFPGEAINDTTTYQSIYAPEGVTSEEYRREVEQSLTDTRYVVEHEDYVVAAEGWANLKYLPRDQTLVYGRQEMALQHMHRTFAERIGMPLPVEG
jgi:phenylpropionate dioxygenase-like ring-hydroxylating dioxygenase large terminal subunit